MLGPRGCLPLAQHAIELTAGPDDTLRRGAEAAHGYLTVMAGDAAGLTATAAAAAAAHMRMNSRLCMAVSFALSSG